MKTIKSIYLIVFLLVTGAVFAENKKPGALVRSTLKGLEYRIKAGVNIGGTSAQLQISVAYFCSIGLYFLV